VISFKIGLGLSFSPDGQRIVSGGDKTVKIWDASE
jgi:WD40 repeat protein